MWSTDGSSELTTAGNKVTCSVPARGGGGNVYNAIWKDEGEFDAGLQSGELYWKVTSEDLQEGNIFAGITDSSKFKKGWSCKGLLYGGNLSDGGALLVSNFGPWLKTGDILGIYVTVDESNIKVYFDVNGRSLGVGFDVPRNTLGNQIYPVVHFSGSGSVTIEKSESFPSTTREEETFTGLSGHWKYSSGSFDPNHISIAISPGSDSNSYKGLMRVINYINFDITSSDGITFRGSLGASTLMAGDPEMMALEREFCKLIQGIISLNEDGKLSISNDGKTSIWSRFTPRKYPVTENPFRC